MKSLFEDQPVTMTGPDVAVTGLAYDSRRVEPGYLFAALRGASSDGHAHIADAIARGASAILAEEVVEDTSVSAIVSTDSRLALAKAARNFFGDPATALAMVGVTGTNGKTTTAFIVEGVLKAAGLRPGVIGTLGARFEETLTETGLTTPQSVELLQILTDMHGAGATAAVMEVSSHALVQHRTSGVSFDVGIFTNLTQDHLDYHGSLDAYFAAKATLLSERLKDGGCAVINLDDAKVATLDGPGVLGFSRTGHPAARIQVVTERLTIDSISLDLKVDGREVSLESPLVGAFNVENILAAFGAGLALGFDPEVVARGIAQVSAVHGRLERVSQPGEPLVVVDYAHTPDALEKALTVLRELTSQRLICVFGCGGDRDSRKRMPMGEAAGRLADKAILTNDNPRTESPHTIAEGVVPGLIKAGMDETPMTQGDGYQIELDRMRAIELAVRAANPGDAVLIAGKGHEDYQIIGDEVRHFDDREAARRVLEMRRTEALI
ncbi:MAG: UDP-N-acetylmuramoyl-L-alanyl-D-glutamate--2,6-diaminopimelate ligase [Myxococcota bacterium]|nr:UDP-N-acetylmuramoyl-L-alanyl-D-glutamate--2,6-diaminopimelate ligase [Myxococcota bacterium]